MHRILQAVKGEAVYIVKTGLASPEHIDGVGLVLALSVQRDVIKDLLKQYNTIAVLRIAVFRWKILV